MKNKKNIYSNITFEKNNKNHAIRSYNSYLKKKILSEFYDIIKNFNVRVILSGGTLLGCIRENNFIEWDDDIDLELYRDEFNSIIHNLMQKLTQKNFEYYANLTEPWEKISIYKEDQKIQIGTLYKNKEYMITRIRKIPAYLFDNPKKIIFKNMDFYVPNPPEKFLNHVYINWKKPIKSDVDIEYLKSSYYRLGYFYKIKYRIKQIIKIVFKKIIK